MSAVCSNEEQHEEDVPAIFDVSFPNGTYNACTACRECVEIIVGLMLDDGDTAVLFTPLTGGSTPIPPEPTDANAPSDHDGGSS